MTIEQVKEWYNKHIDTEKNKLSRLKNIIFRIGSIRLALVLIAAIICYLWWGNTFMVTATIAASVIIFLYLLKYHNKLFWQKRYCELLIQNAQNELKGIAYDYSAFDGAAEKANANHSFSLDLDIFGNRSFFQSTNRTVTNYGKDRLAERILYPSTHKKTILLQQKAIEELSKKPQLLAHFVAIGQMSDTKDLDVHRFAEQFLSPTSLHNTFWRFMAYIASVSFVVVLLLYIFGTIPSVLFGAYYVVASLISLSQMKAIKAKMRLFDNNREALERYASLLKIIENEDFESQYAQALRTKVTAGRSASAAIKQLDTDSNNLDQSTTVIGLAVLCPIFFWNIIYMLKVEKWIVRHKENIPQWFDTISEFDSLVSLATFAYNHPDYIYPHVADTFTFEGKDLGHPLIDRAVCVRNDVSLPRKPYFLVVTGANMAGKSTYLRTIGINHTMACAGLPVCATSLTFYPSQLVTNLRTTDSLTDNESYFFAELKRLKMIIDRLQAGEQLFIILDEILKGTNSEDKQKGSIALMKQLVSLSGNGIIATHDLVLGELEQQYPEIVKNYRFEADIKNDNLSFSYKLREGVAQNMNACFLMKKMGITGL